MDPKLRLALRLLAILLIGFFAIQPFNWFCQISKTCKPFFLSYYLPKRLGNEIKISFEITNYNRGLKFSVSQTSIDSFTNKKNLVTYHATNISKKTIKFRPALIVEPDYVKDYLVRYECPCFRHYSLKSGEGTEMNMEFEVSRKIQDDKRFKKEEVIKIRYKI